MPSPTPRMQPTTLARSRSDVVPAGPSPAPVEESESSQLTQPTAEPETATAQRPTLSAACRSILVDMPQRCCADHCRLKLAPAWVVRARQELAELPRLDQVRALTDLLRPCIVVGRVDVPDSQKFDYSFNGVLVCQTTFEWIHGCNRQQIKQAQLFAISGKSAEHGNVNIRRESVIE